MTTVVIAKSMLLRMRLVPVASALAPSYASYKTRVPSCDTMRIPICIYMEFRSLCSFRRPYFLDTVAA